MSEALARKFHEAYERLAPQFGYETRPETRQFDPESPNGRLMIAVVKEVFGPAIKAEMVLAAARLPRMSDEEVRSTFAGMGQQAGGLLVQLRRDRRAIHARGGARFTTARDPNGAECPIEACFVLVIGPDDETEVRSVVSANGVPGFLQCSRYPVHARFLAGELGYMDGGIRVILDLEHDGPPKLLCAGERVLTFAEETKP